MTISPYVIPGLKRNLMNLNAEQRALEIIDCVLEDSEYTYSEIKKRVRDRPIVYHRQLCMFFLRGKTDLTLRKIGELLSAKFKGKKPVNPYDHATVINSIKTINNLIFSDQTVRQEVESIKRKLL